MAAVRAIEQADLIVSPVARPGEVGMAARIASRWIKPDQPQRSHVFPMVEAPQPRQQAWKAEHMVPVHVCDEDPAQL